MKLLYTVWVFLMCLRICFSSPLIHGETRIQDFESFNENYRLDTTTIPTNYEIKLSTYFQADEAPNKKQFTFEGSVRITLMSKIDIKEFTLHSSGLNIKNKPILKWKDDANDTMKITDMETDEKTEKLKLTLSRLMPKDSHFNITFDYDGQLKDEMFGFYRSYYTRSDGSKAWLAVTQFEPVYARKAFPCFDEPQFKATFQITLNHHKNYTANSNTLKTEEVEDTETKDRINTKFKITPKMPTYLVAFLVSDLKMFGDEKHIAVIAREDAESQTSYALEIGKRSLKKLEEFTGLPYQKLGIPKMYFAAIPDFNAGAMENWGLITFKEKYLLYDSEETSEADKQFITIVISHEQVHMWFGDYITCAFWNVTWLNEGFAEYFEHFITHEVEPKWSVDKQFILTDVQASFLSDSLSHSHPMTNQNSNSRQESINMFDRITYRKGASIIRMIHHMMGKNKFKEGLRSYIKNSKLALSTALPEDLFKALKSKWNNKNIDLDVIKADWTEQAGYPVVTVELNDDRKSFKVSQKRFLLNGESSGLKYTVPFTYATSEDVDFESTEPDFYMTKNKHFITINLDEPVDWIVGNKLQTGYYRVNYNDLGWELLHHALKQDDFGKIHEMNRAQIVDDLFNFGRSGLMKYDRVLHLLEYLRKETNYLPWYSAHKGFQFLINKIKQDEYELLKDHILELLQHSYRRFGFTEKEEDNALDVYNRALILKLACDLGHEDCIQRSKHYFEKLKNDDSPVPVNIRIPVYCTAIRVGSESDFDFLWDKYKSCKVGTECQVILQSLGCPSSKTTVKKFLNHILSPLIRSQDKQDAFMSIYSDNKESVPVIFNYIKSNFNKFIDVFGPKQTLSMLSGLSFMFTTEDEKKELQQFLNQNKKKFGKLSNGIEKIVDKVNDNLIWCKEKLPPLYAYLKKSYSNANQLIFNFILQIFLTIILLQNY